MTISDNKRQKKVLASITTALRRQPVHCSNIGSPLQYERLRVKKAKGCFEDAWGFR
jgi:hypothetical protein